MVNIRNAGESQTLLFLLLLLLLFDMDISFHRPFLPGTSLEPAIIIIIIITITITVIIWKIVVI